MKIPFREFFFLFFDKHRPVSEINTELRRWFFDNFEGSNGEHDIEKVIVNSQEQKKGGSPKYGNTHVDKVSETKSF